VRAITELIRNVSLVRKIRLENVVAVGLTRWILGQEGLGKGGGEKGNGEEGSEGNGSKGKGRHRGGEGGEREKDEFCAVGDFSFFCLFV